jgi:hypothetical protein
MTWVMAWRRVAQRTCKWKRGEGGDDREMTLRAAAFSIALFETPPYLCVVQRAREATSGCVCKALVARLVVVRPAVHDEGLHA